MIKYVACFTGHCPFGLPWGFDESKENCLRFKRDLFEILKNAILFGVETFLTGMAQGFDLIASEIIIQLKKDFPNVKLVAVIPCKDQTKNWRANQKERYYQILNYCDEKIISSEKYYDGCMNYRNLWMVQHSNICIACWNNKRSGTYNTIKFAKENGLKLKIINTENYR